MCAGSHFKYLQYPLVQRGSKSKSKGKLHHLSCLSVRIYLSVWIFDCFIVKVRICHNILLLQSISSCICSVKWNNEMKPHLCTFSFEILGLNYKTNHPTRHSSLPHHLECNKFLMTGLWGITFQCLLSVMCLYWSPLGHTRKSAWVKSAVGPLQGPDVPFAQLFDTVLLFIRRYYPFERPEWKSYPK